MSEEIWSIWDLDGCLSDDRARKHFVIGRERDYDAYHRASINDPIRIAEASLLRAWVTISPYHHVAIFTGRPSTYSARTAEWLKRHGLWALVDSIKMREEGDHSRTEDVKHLMYRQLMDKRPDRHVLFAVDDRDVVIQMWRRLGIKCLRSITDDGEEVQEDDRQS